ncbi:2-oxoglutarate synthase [Desulfocarbo indianensis]|nr:2-oxoglutarate synthase [Desulfocarbo indianensis]
MPETTLLNSQRPPLFCPGCSHDSVLKVLDKVFVNMGLAANQICMVSDIGCSGLFDTFFNTHAFHGVHGRALTYATAMKLCRPELNVVVTMGDGGLGIGGAHVLSACRRNADITLLVLNNFNFGMTGGQCSATTPQDAVVGSGFLNRLDLPLDLQKVARAAGAPYVAVASTYQKDLGAILREAIEYKGFSVVEIQGLCPGRYTKRNQISPKSIAEEIAPAQEFNGEVKENVRPDYGQAYRAQAAAQRKVPRPAGLQALYKPPQEDGRQTVMLLGAAGQRAITAGELAGMAGLLAGLQVTQKNEYNITVLRGPSITELIFSATPIDYTGITQPDVVLALAPEGVERRYGVFAQLPSQTLVIRAAGVELPETRAQVETVDFKALGLNKLDWALGSLAVMAKMNKVISREMLQAALEARFRGKVLEASNQVVDKVYAGAA